MNQKTVSIKIPSALLIECAKLMAEISAKAQKAGMELQYKKTANLMFGLWSAIYARDHHNNELIPFVLDETTIDNVFSPIMDFFEQQKGAKHQNNIKPTFGKNCQ